MKQNTPYISSLALLKLIAVFGILGCHTSLIRVFDACGRMVEILFLASGFLMAYNHYMEAKVTTAWQVVKKKLPHLYPIHLICFLLQWLFVATWAMKPISYLFSVGILNLTLQQAWFVRTEFSFNNVSWFLSALVFCYAMTPSIKNIIKSAEKKKYGLLKALIAIAAIRYYCDYLADHASRYVSLDIHCNPFVQMLNYALGYITAVGFMQKNAFNKMLKEGISAWQLSILQILVISIYILCCQRFAEVYRFYFVIIGLPVFYILAFDRGIIEKIGSLKVIRWLSGMTLEIFMFHSFILYKLPTNHAEPMSYIIFLGVTMAVSIAYHETYRFITKTYTK